MAPTGHAHKSTSGSRVTDYFKHGDLVLVKVGSYPAWPAKISKPEDFKRTPDTWRYFVKLFGTNELAFVAPSDIQLYTGEIKIRPRGKSNVFDDFAKAVKEINESYEFQRKSLLKDHQNIARQEKEKEASREGEMKAVKKESNVEKSTVSASIRDLIALADKEKAKGASSQSLQQVVSRRTPIIASVQLRADLPTRVSFSTDASVACDAFKGILEILSEGKESIHRATRFAFDCAKNGIASEVIELIIEKCENESSMPGRVKLFFLVDSIMKQSQRKKDIAGACFIPLVQDQLPRLLAAAAPSDVDRLENHRQCAKILRLWIKRKIMPENYLQPYVDNIEIFIENSSLAERPSNNQEREIDGIIVEEYGSNATLPLPGHWLSNMSIEEAESCNEELEIGDVSVHEEHKNEFPAGGREMYSPPSPRDSLPLTPPLPTSPMPPLPPYPPSQTPPPPPLPSHDPVQSLHLQRPMPPILGPQGPPMMPYGQRSTYHYSWRPA